ncbi:hypothetical protein EDC15_103150 [Acetobacter aceti NBRC 14818]|nr:hypothetical protein EDC15_103150 [Acetobacter aceti NBRC 14818]
MAQLVHKPPAVWPFLPFGPPHGLHASPNHSVERMQYTHSAPLVQKPEIWPHPIHTFS